MFATSIHPTSFTAESCWPAAATFATVEMHDGTGSSASVFLTSPEACDELIKATMRAKSMLLGETSEPAGDTQAARGWAVFKASGEPGREDVKVAGPFTRREAAEWAAEQAEVCAPSFAGRLYVGPARTDLPGTDAR